MKKLLNFISLMLILTLTFGCQDMIITDVEEEPQINNQEVITRAGAPEEISSSNEHLIYNWENVTKIVLNTHGEVDAPWNLTEGHSVSISEGIATDIKKKDGWNMIFHKMMSKSSGEPNFMVFYNNKRGTLKTFYHNHDAVANNGMVWIIEPSNSQNRNIPSNLKYEEVLNSTTFNKKSSTTNLTRSWDPENIGPLTEDWNAFEFELNYAPNGQNESTKFSFGGYASRLGKIKADGDYTGKINIPSGNKQESGFFSKITEVIKGIGNVFKISPKILDFLLPKNNSETFADLGDMGNKLSNLSSIMGKAAGYFDEKGDPIYVTATSKGKMNLSGTLEQQLEGVVSSLYDLDLKKLNNNKELGLWTLKEEPTIKFNRYEAVFNDNINFPYSNNRKTIKHILDQSGDANAAKTEIRKNVVINPEMLSEIDKYDVKVSFCSMDPIMSMAVKQEKIANGIYSFGTELNTDVNYYTPLAYSGYYAGSGAKNRIFALDRYILFYGNYGSPGSNYKYQYGKLLVNVTVTFHYKDKSKFVSSKNFKAKLDVSLSHKWDASQSHYNTSLVNNDPMNIVYVYRLD